MADGRTENAADPGDAAVRNLQAPPSAIRALPLWLACLFILVAPNFDLLPFAGVYDEKRLLQLLVFALTAAWLATHPAGRGTCVAVVRALPPVARKFLAAVAVGGIVSAAFAAFPRAALLEVSSVTMLALLALALAAGFRLAGQTSHRTVVLAVALSATAYVAGFTILYIAGLYVSAGPPPSYREVWPGFAHVRFLGQWQTWTLPLIVLPMAMFTESTKTMRAGQQILAACWWALLLAAGTRGTYVAEAVAFVTVALMFGRSSLVWLRLQARSIFAGAVLYLFTYVIVAGDRSAFLDMFAHITARSTSGRSDLWQAAIDATLSSPLLGIGPQHYVYVRPEGAFAAHPHNALLQWSSEWGLVSALIVAGLAAWGLIAWLRRAREELVGHEETDRTTLLVALSASLVAGGVHMMLSGLIVMPMSQMQMVIVVAWALSLHLRPSPETPGPAPPAGQIALACGAVLSLSMLLACSAPDLNRRQFDTAPRSETIGPRFWLYGKLISLDPGHASAEPVD